MTTVSSFCWSRILICSLKETHFQLFTVRCKYQSVKSVQLCRSEHRERSVELEWMDGWNNWEMKCLDGRDDWIVMEYCIRHIFRGRFYFREFRESGAICKFNNTRWMNLPPIPMARMRLVYIRNTGVMYRYTDARANEWMNTDILRPHVHDLLSILKDRTKFKQNRGQCLV